MLDKQMVIKGLECCAAMSGDECRKCPYEHECRSTDLSFGIPHLAADALALLQEQEPIRPELCMSKHGFRQWIVCGNCYGKMRGLYDYCPWCGKKIKWNNKENKDGT